jgi:hypothetical protein
MTPKERYWFEKGYHKALDDNHILYGKAAERFMKEVECPRKPSKKQQAFLDKCSKMLKETKLK